MKYTKIILITLVLVALGFLAYTLINQKTEELPEVTLTDNKWINDINDRIDALKNSEIDIFTKKTYDEIIYYIQEYSNSNKITEQWSSNLRKKLEYVYFEKFIKEANYTLSNSLWKKEDIKFIRDEIKRLGNSQFIQDAAALMPIQRVLIEYDEINSFLASAKGFATFSGGSNFIESFPKLKAKDIIDKANEKNKTSSLVKNNSELMSELANVRKNIYQKHFRFIEAKIEKLKRHDCSSYYSNFTYDKGYSSYFNQTCKHIFDDINEFKDNANTLYGVSTDEWYSVINSYSSQISSIASKAKSRCF